MKSMQRAAFLGVFAGLLGLSACATTTQQHRVAMGPSAHNETVGTQGSTAVAQRDSVIEMRGAVAADVGDRAARGIPTPQPARDPSVSLPTPQPPLPLRSGPSRGPSSVAYPAEW